MIALLQRVNWARVKIEGNIHSEINEGLLVFVGLEKNDNEEIADRLLKKILAYRIFSDSDEKMNLSLKDIKGELLLVSQFTLAAETEKGLRPGFSSAMPPQQAKSLYDYVVSKAEQRHERVGSGVFAADMKIELENNGPVTFILRA